MGSASSFRDDPDYIAYRQTVRSFVATEVMPYQDDWRTKRVADREVWQKAGSLGLLLNDVPEDYGGGGGTAVHAAALPEELALAGDSCLGGVVVQGTVAQYLLNYGTAAQKARYLPGLASGSLIASIAITEPDAGSDMQAMRTSVMPSPSGYVLNGTKRYVSNGQLGDLVLVAARTPPTGRISLVLVERHSVTGLSAGPLADMIGRHGQDVCDLFFDEVELPADSVLGDRRGYGFSQLMRELPYERTFIGVTAAAGIERALALAVEHAKARQLYGRPLLHLQNTRFQLSRAKTQAVVVRTFIDHCLARLAIRQLDAEAAAMAKWFATDVACEVIDSCLQLSGGDGYMADHPMGRMYVDARVQRIYGGANEVMLELIAQTL
jgi:acyl-CoA dehydrogenase